MRLALTFTCGACTVSAITKIKLGQDVNYPPYAYRSEETGELAGFGKDVADGMNALCDDLEIEVVETAWSNCWTSEGGGSLGVLIENGTLDACSTYTHTQGIRDELCEFSHGIQNVNKAAGLLTLLENGKPKVHGYSNLEGVTVVDVGGWAPTADTISFVTNKCTNQPYSDQHTMVVAEGNDAAMKMLRNGQADAMFVYADQAEQLQCGPGVEPEWNCTLWEGFGTEYAYVQSGQYNYMVNGTTLTLSKKGSGVAEKVNPCLVRFMETKEYYEACVKHDLVDSCYRNEFFPPADEVIREYNKATSEHEGDCSNGYCPCTHEDGSGPTKIKLGQDVNYPPYAYRSEETGELAGFGKDVADGMNALCDDLEIEVVETAWSNCWTSEGGGSLGALLEDGTLDACSTYTHTQGIRDELCEFSHGIQNVNKAAGLLTLLENGKPKVNGYSNLKGVTVVDVGGWAPTADTIAFVTNKCTNQPYSDQHTMVVAEGNDAAMEMLRNGQADAMFVYADQAEQLQCGPGVEPEWNCTLWEGFGTEYAYVQTGQYNYMVNGTTLTLSKKGSGVAEKVNPCLVRFMETKEYYEACVKHDLIDSCYRNEFFPPAEEAIREYNKATSEHESDCSNGYCPCSFGSEEEPEGPEISGVVSGVLFDHVLTGFIIFPLATIMDIV